MMLCLPKLLRMSSCRKLTIPRRTQTLKPWLPMSQQITQQPIKSCNQWTFLHQIFSPSTFEQNAEVKSFHHEKYYLFLHIHSLSAADKCQPSVSFCDIKREKCESYWVQYFRKKKFSLQTTKSQSPLGASTRSIFSCQSIHFLMHMKNIFWQCQTRPCPFFKSRGLCCTHKRIRFQHFDYTSFMSTLFFNLIVVICALTPLFFSVSVIIAILSFRCTQTAEE